MGLSLTEAHSVRAGHRQQMALWQPNGGALRVLLSLSTCPDTEETGQTQSWELSRKLSFFFLAKSNSANYDAFRVWVFFLNTVNQVKFLSCEERKGLTFHRGNFLLMFPHLKISTYCITQFNKVINITMTFSYMYIVNFGLISHLFCVCV